MNERIKELAEQAGAYFGGGSTDHFGDYIPPYMSIADLDAEKFAELVRADEREACAKVCEEDGLLWGQRYAAAIRARGTT